MSWSCGSRNSSSRQQLEAFRLRQRTQYDWEMLRELGKATASRTIPHPVGCRPGEPLHTLDFFPKDFLVS